ncbi:MAG: hypothetical protein ACREDJ_06175 [Methylocella sp.]
MEVAAFDKKKPDFPRVFLPFENGAPSHESLELVFAALGAKQFLPGCFNKPQGWLLTYRRGWSWRIAIWRRFAMVRNLWDAPGEIEERSGAAIITLSRIEPSQKLNRR